jgi:hypothetical protein
MRSLLHFKASAIRMLISFVLIVLCMPAICLGDAGKIYKENSPAVVVVVSIDSEESRSAREAASLSARMASL